MEIVAIWVAIGAICYGLAVKKGKNPFIALGLGVIFGIFALAYYLLCKGSKEYELKKAEKKVKEAKERT